MLPASSACRELTVLSSITLLNVQSSMLGAKRRRGEVQSLSFSDWCPICVHYMQNETSLTCRIWSISCCWCNWEYTGVPHWSKSKFSFLQHIHSKNNVSERLACKSQNTIFSLRAWKALKSFETNSSSSLYFTCRSSSVLAWWPSLPLSGEKFDLE